MRVLQSAKRSVLTVAAVCVALSGCANDSGPVVPFNPTGASADLQAVGSTFGSETFTSFSSLSLLFDAALGGTPLVSATAQALDVQGTAGTTAAAARSAERIARMIPRAANGSFSAASAAIPAQFLGKTFVYSGGVYVVSALTGAPVNGVRFKLYALDPVTLAPLQPLVETGHVDLIDMSSGTTSKARVMVLSGSVTYLDYTVTATSTATSGNVTVVGMITDGSTDATFNLRSTLTFNAGLTLGYTLDVPQRDLRIDLTLTASGLTPQSGDIGVVLDMRGQNGWVRLTGQFTATGGTLNVAINGIPFATITSTAGAAPVITGANGQPLTAEETAALQSVFEFSSSSFTAFDQLIAPVGTFVA